MYGNKSLKQHKRVRNGASTLAHSIIPPKPSDQGPTKSVVFFPKSVLLLSKSFYPILLEPFIFPFTAIVAVFLTGFRPQVFFVRVCTLSINIILTQLSKQRIT